MTPLPQMIAQSSADDAAGGVVFIVWLLVIVLVVAGFWRVFTKAGEPGWAAIVPIFNLYVLLKVAGRPWWFLLLYFIPVVNIITTAIVSIDVAKAFGKGTGFGIGLWLLSFIFYPILGFGSAEYIGPPAR